MHSSCKHPRRWQPGAAAAARCSPIRCDRLTHRLNVAQQRGDMTCRALERARELLDAAAAQPRVLVLDLDYTIWPFWCETKSEHDTPHLYPEAECIIDACRERGMVIAAASRTPTPHVARAFMRKLRLDAKFDECQLIPAADGFDSTSAQKDHCHLPNIQKATGAAFSEMLFFDDELGNIAKVSRLGVCSVLVPTSTGLCLDTFQQGLVKFAQQR